MATQRAKPGPLEPGVLRRQIAELGLDVRVLAQPAVLRVDEVADDDLVARGGRPESASRMKKSQSVSSLRFSSSPPIFRTNSVFAITDDGQRRTFWRLSRAVAPRSRRGKGLEDLPLGRRRPSTRRRRIAGFCRRVELRAKLPGRPEVVVVEERDPVPARGVDPVVERSRLAALLRAKHRLHARVGDRGELLLASVVGGVVDDETSTSTSSWLSALASA